jgi:hypothetical protein
VTGERTNDDGGLRVPPMPGRRESSATWWPATALTSDPQPGVSAAAWRGHVVVDDVLAAAGT